MRHPSHTDLVKRLKRAEGHLHALIAMMEAGKPCLDLAQQLHAVENALANAKRALIHDHLSGCLEDAVHSGSMKPAALLSEFKALSKYL